MGACDELREAAYQNPYLQYMYSYPHKTAYRPLENLSLKEYAPLFAGGGHGLYLHIPFCETKCGYCNLFSVAGEDAAADRYLDAVERQCRQYAALLKPYGAEFSEAVIGGGTPFFLTGAQMERMFDLLDTYFCFHADRGLIIETAPNQTTAEKLAVIRRAGAVRVSMGVQSFSDRELAVLGRRHDAARAMEALALLKSFDFPCVNVDFIYGIPGQTAESLCASLSKALSYEPDEIFLYPLYVKHGAGLVRKGVVPDPAAAYAQYLCAGRFLRENGFRQDSMRRFVRGSGKRAFSECGFGTSLALGCGGRSYAGNLHFCSPYAITRKDCLLRLDEYENTDDFTRITHGIVLSEEEIRRRYVIRHLLICPGLERVRYRQRFHSDVTDDFPVLKDWMECGFVQETEFLFLTKEGLGLSDYLGPQLISPRVGAAMREWEEGHEGTHDFVPRQSEKL